MWVAIEHLCNGHTIDMLKFVSVAHLHNGHAHFRMKIEECCCLNAERHANFEFHF